MKGGTENAERSFYMRSLTLFLKIFKKLRDLRDLCVSISRLFGVLSFFMQ